MSNEIKNNDKPNTDGILGKVSSGSEKNPQKAAKKGLLRILILLLLIAIVLLVLKQCGVFDKQPTPIVAGDLLPGAGDAEDGTLSNMSDDDIREQMQKAADEAYFSFKINTIWEFEDRKGEAAVGIENPNYNVYPMVVQVFLGKDGAGELIYDSGAIMPDQHIDNAKLTKVLKTGTYEALAYLNAYDPDTKENIFKSTAELSIVIKNQK